MPITAKMLAEKDLDIVLIATPDHWHALPMIAAVEAGADVYVQKPISIDVAEGQAMLAAARKHGRVVQVGMQRRSTPHLIEARERIIREGKLGRIGLVEIYCYYHMRNDSNPPDSRPPEYLDYEMWTGPAPLRPYNRSSTRGAGGPSWNTATASSATCACTCSTPSAGCSTWAGRSESASSGGIFVHKGSKANISDTQTATFDYDDLNVVWQHRTWGPPPDPKYPWGMTFYGDKGTLKASVMSYDFTPNGPGEPIHRDVTYEREQYPEDVTEKDIEIHVAPALRQHMKDFLAAIASRGQAGGRHRARPHFHRELHPGQSLHEARPYAGLGRRERPCGRRRGSQPPACAGHTADRGCIRRGQRSEARGQSSTSDPRPLTSDL